MKWKRLLAIYTMACVSCCSTTACKLVTLINYMRRTGTTSEKMKNKPPAERYAQTSYFHTKLNHLERNWNGIGDKRNKNRSLGSYLKTKYICYHVVLTTSFMTSLYNGMCVECVWCWCGKGTFSHIKCGTAKKNERGKGEAIVAKVTGKGAGSATAGATKKVVAFIDPRTHMLSPSGEIFFSPDMHEMGNGKDIKYSGRRQGDKLQLLVVAALKRDYTITTTTTTGRWHISGKTEQQVALVCNFPLLRR